MKNANQIIAELQKDPLQLISFINAEGEGKWYLIPFDYWVMNHWGQYGINFDWSDLEQETLFLDKVSKFELTLQELKDAKDMNRGRLIPDILLEPSVYADFTQRILFSTFGEYAIENAVLESWEGKHAGFADMIPVESKY